MALKDKFVVRQSAAPREELEQLAATGKHAAATVTHAQILLKADAEVTALLSAAELEEKFDLDYHLKQVDTIFARVFGAA